MILEILNSRGKIVGSKELTKGSLWALDDDGFRNTATVEVPVKGKGRATKMRIYNDYGKQLTGGTVETEDVKVFPGCKLLFSPGKLHITLEGPA